MLFKKMLRDMGRHKTQFISIFLMAFLAVFIYAGVGGEWKGLQKSSDSFYRATNLADIWVYGSGFTEEQEKAVSEIEGVVQTERRLDLEASADLENKPRVTLSFVTKNDISSLYLLEGTDFDGNDTDGIWLDKRFSDARGLSVGDSISLSYNGFSFTKTIRGLIDSSEYVYMSGGDGMTPDFYENGYAYLSYQAFPVPEMLTYSTLLIKTDDSGTDWEEAVGKALNGKYSVFLLRENHPSVNMFANEVSQHRMMGDIFPVVFLAIALLTMMTTMTRIVTAQRVQIGTLKALGFKKRSIVAHYLSYGFWLSLAGSVLGAVLGPLSLPHLFYPSMSGFYTLPEWKPAFSLSFLGMAGLVVAACTLVTYIACRNLLRETPAQALRPKAPRAMRHGIIEKSLLWGRLGFNSQWNLRDASRNRVRSLMAVIGVFGCTALLVCAFGMYDGMQDLKDWQYTDINKFESKLTVKEDASEEQISSVKDKVNGELLMEGSVEIRSEKTGKKKTGALTVTDHVTLISPTDFNRSPITLPQGGVSITCKMADSLGVSEGDMISWHVYGEENWVTTKVAALYREPTSQGISLTRECFEELGFSFRPTSILSAQKMTGTYEGIAGILSTADILQSWDDLTEAMMVMVYILILAAAVLSVVVLYNLGLLSFTEMEREMATLKVMGLKTRKLRGLLLTQNLWFSVIGFALGVPGGLWLVQIMVSSSGESFDFPIRLHAANFLLSFAITFGLSVLVNRLFSKKIRKINMVEALKGAE